MHIVQLTFVCFVDKNGNNDDNNKEKSMEIVKSLLLVVFVIWDL